MTITQSIMYGFVQGVAEYLPISSSAHLILLPKFMGEQDPGLAFDVFLHLGTLAATLLFFGQKWINLIKKWIKNPKDFSGLTLNTLALATLPALLFGFLFHRWIENELRAVIFISLGLSTGGVLLYLVDRFQLNRSSSLPQWGVWEFIQVGLFQCLSLIPGMSRSGSTLMGGRWLGLTRKEAAECSFMMSAPVTLAAIVYESKNLMDADRVSLGSTEVLLAGGLSSFVFGILAIGFLLKLLQKIGFLHFMIYRVVLAGVIYFIF